MNKTKVYYYIYRATLQVCSIIINLSGLAKSCIDWRSTLIKIGTRKKRCAAYEDLDHFASISFHSVACLHVCGRFLGPFFVAQYNQYAF